MGKKLPGGGTGIWGREVENEVREVVWSQMKLKRILDFISNLPENNLGERGLSRGVP